MRDAQGPIHPPLASPPLPGPWVEMAWLVVGPRGHRGLSRGWAPSLVRQALLDGHLDQLLFTQAAIQAVFLLSNGTLSAPSGDLSRHLGHLSSSFQKSNSAVASTQQVTDPCEETKPPVTECFTRQPGLPTGQTVHIFKHVCVCLHVSVYT